MPPLVDRVERETRSTALVNLVLAGSAVVSAVITPSLWALFGSIGALGLVGYGLARAKLPGLAALAATIGAAIHPWYGIATPEPTTSIVTEIGWLTLSMCLAAATFRPASFVAWWLVNAAGLAVLTQAVGIPPVPRQALASLVVLLGVVGVVFTVQRSRIADALEAHERELVRARRAALEREGATRHRLEGAEGQLVASARAVALGELAASVSHELNNPMTALFLAIRELERASDPRIEAPLGQAREAAESCRAVVQRLMRHADRGLGKPELVDLEAVVRDTMDLVRRHLELQGTHVFAQVTGPLPIRVRVEHVREVLLALLMRAPEGDAAREIELRAWPEDGRAWLEVRGLGPAPPAPDVAMLTVASLLKREEGSLEERGPDLLLLALPLAERS